MMTYKELFKDKQMTEEISERISEIMERHAGDNEHMKYEIAYALHDGHLCEYTANYRIKHMQAVAYIGEDKSVMHGINSMHEYLSAMGITPETAHRHITAAFDKARAKAREKGFSAPQMGNVNVWDCYWCLAMMLADYWFTVCGDLEIASMLAYEYLSDPDR